GGSRKPTVPGPLGWAGMRRLASVQASILIVMALALAFVHASQIGAPAQAQGMSNALAAAQQRVAPPGYLKVFVEPWAEVFVDGQYAETTPFARALTLPEGSHVVGFKNPFFQPAE